MCVVCCVPLSKKFTSVCWKVDSLVEHSCFKVNGEARREKRERKKNMEKQNLVLNTKRWNKRFATISCSECTDAFCCIEIICSLKSSEMTTTTTTTMVMMMMTWRKIGEMQQQNSHTFIFTQQHCSLFCSLYLSRSSVRHSQSTNKVLLIQIQSTIRFASYHPPYVCSLALALCVLLW